MQAGGAAAYQLVLFLAMVSGVGEFSFSLGLLPLVLGVATLWLLLRPELPKMVTLGLGGFAAGAAMLTLVDNGFDPFLPVFFSVIGAALLLGGGLLQDTGAGGSAKSPLVGKSSS
jgi:hypothetical protein